MDLETIILSEVSQTVKDKLHMISPICGVLKKKKRIQMNSFARNETDSQTLKNLLLPKGTGWGVGGMDWGLGLAYVH